MWIGVTDSGLGSPCAPVSCESSSCVRINRDIIHWCHCCDENFILRTEISFLKEITPHLFASSPSTSCFSV